MVSAVALVSIGALALMPQTRAQHEDGPAQSATQAKLEEIFQALLRGGRGPALQHRDALKALGAQNLSPLDRDEWLGMARDAALRLGDRVWLESLSAVPSRFASDTTYTVLLAYGQLQKADLKTAEATLNRLDEPLKRGEINVREERRILALRARIAQLRGENRAERESVEALVGHLPHWASPECQRCHNAPKTPKEITSLPLADLWFGERFVEILKRDGDAQRVRQQSEAQLARDPSDALARIRLGYALQALGQDADAEKAFRALPWADFPGRDLKKPRMVTTFP